MMLDISCVCCTPVSAWRFISSWQSQVCTPEGHCNDSLLGAALVVHQWREIETFCSGCLVAISLQRLPH